jgi:hypothetical protein
MMGTNLNERFQSLASRHIMNRKKAFAIYVDLRSHTSGLLRERLEQRRASY